MEFNAQEKLFNDLIIEWNKKINLVSRKKENVYDLIIDSRLFIDYVTDDSFVLDLGTGGGFPGIVLKIHKPEIKLVLIDSVQKKINAVNDIISKLKLKDIETVWSRAEDLYRSEKYNNVFEFVVSRSVAELTDLVKWSSRLLNPAGVLLTLKGTEITDEIDKAHKLNIVKSIECNKHGDRQMIKCMLN
jgi:16S rRNA (guanine527-N7)-methyltransferase